MLPLAELLLKPKFSNQSTDIYTDLNMQQSNKLNRQIQSDQKVPKLETKQCQIFIGKTRTAEGFFGNWPTYSSWPSKHMYTFITRAKIHKSIYTSETQGQVCLQ